MTLNIKRTSDIGRVVRAKGRNYSEIDGIRIVFEDGKLEGWYNPGPEDSGNESTTPSEE